MSFRLSVFCPAKINIFLAVGPVDSRKYHPIRSVFQALMFGDDMLVEPGDDEVSFVGQDIPARNTVTKALRLVREIAPLPGLKLTITKRIPSQAGLGGGSSNAAGLLRVTKHLLPGLPQPELLAIAEAVGADVPFFLTGGSVKAEGYGEKLTPLADPEQKHVVIIKPDVDCSTIEMYARLDQSSFPFRDFPAGEELYNDFERVTPCESMDWAERIEVHGAYGAGLTGSGSAVFGLFRNEPSAMLAVANLEREGAPGLVQTRFASRAECLAVTEL